MQNEAKCLFEIVRDTPAKALTWHSAPYTGPVEFVVPRGMGGWLGKRMGILTHYFDPAEGYCTKEWLDAVVAKAREVSPIPDRFNGALSFFIPIRTLLGDSVRFLPADGDLGCFDQEGILSVLREEYGQAINYARHEESESFRNLVKLGMCSPRLTEEERRELLKDKQSADR